MILPAQWIRKHGRDGLITPFYEEAVNPASYDVTLHPEIVARIDEKATLPLTLMPGEFIIASTNERVKVPHNVAIDLKLKSTIGRKGINHALSGWIDPGFEGQITLELQNISGQKVVLEPNMKIAQLIFMQLVEPTDLPYTVTGRYCGQMGPTLARPERKR
jgi:dCTP deaminase